MKLCPACHTSYADDLSFCLNDGTPLVSSVGEETIISPRGDDRRAIHISTAPTEPGGQPTMALGAPPPPSSAPPVKKGGSSFAIIAVVLLFLLLAGGAGVFVVASMLLSRNNNNNTRVAAETPTPTATPKATPAVTPSPKQSATPDEDDGTKEIQDALAELQKKMEKELKKSGSSTEDWSNDDGHDDSEQLGTMAFADSPEDGFLALRSQPSSDAGTRVAKIPHGAKMTINKCGKIVTTKLGNRGRWCTAGYAGKIGWVFDKYVRY